MSQITKISVDGTVYDLPAGLVSSVNGETGDVSVTADGIGAATKDDLSAKRSLTDLAVYDVPRPKLSIGYYKLTLADGSVPVDDYTLEVYGSVESSSETDVEQRVVVKYVNTHTSSDVEWRITVRLVYSRTRVSSSDAWGEWTCVLSNATGDADHRDAGGVFAYWVNQIREYWPTKAPEYDKDTNTYTSSLTSNYYGDATLTFRPEFRAQSPAATGDTLATVKAVSAAASATDSNVEEVGKKVDSVKEKTDILDTTGVTGLNALGRSWSNVTSDNEETGRQYLNNLPVIGQISTVLGGDTSGDTVQAIVKKILEKVGDEGQENFYDSLVYMMKELYGSRPTSSSVWLELEDVYMKLQGRTSDGSSSVADGGWDDLISRVKTLYYFVGDHGSDVTSACDGVNGGYQLRDGATTGSLREFLNERQAMFEMLFVTVCGENGIASGPSGVYTLHESVNSLSEKVDALTTKVDSVMAKLDSLTTLITDTIAAQKASVASLDKDESSLSDVVTALQSMNGTSSEGGAK